MEVEVHTSEEHEEDGDELDEVGESDETVIPAHQSTRGDGGEGETCRINEGQPAQQEQDIVDHGEYGIDDDERFSSVLHPDRVIGGSGTGEFVGEDATTDTEHR